MRQVFKTVVASGAYQRLEFVGAELQALFKDIRAAS
jgi:hypothetical protein